jgi:uncharacterized Zn finger protein
MTAKNLEQIQREWWVERWLELLDSYRFKKRLERARVYARQGHVLSIEFKGSKVLAKVQGTEVEPYQVSLWLDSFTDEDWDYIIQSISEKAIYSAKMLAGMMPENIQEVFTKNGLSLFPFRLDNVHSKCSCPDKANPCKHIGAVYYLLGDRFSEDPFVLFQLRGRTKEQILTGLRQDRIQKLDQKPASEAEKEPTKKLPATQLNIQQFWEYSEQLESSLVVIAPAPTSDTILDNLGAIPFTSETEIADFKTDSVPATIQYLKDIYTQVSQQAILYAMTSDFANS